MKKIFYSPYFWLVFILLSAGSIFIAKKLSPLAFPIVHIDLQMNKNDALIKASDQSKKYNIGPKDYESTASFTSNTYDTTFIELEGGGRRALVRVLEEGLYQPFTWTVRHFEPLKTHEALFIFTPEGKPYGFIETISEDTFLPSMLINDAEDLAKKTAHVDYAIDFNDYELIESAHFENVNKRIDYSFVYERKDQKIGDGRFRLKLTIKGDRLTELVHVLHVPEGFSRRYQEMRSLNERIAFFADGAVLVLYILICGFIGLIFMMKERFILWRKSLVIAGIVALLNWLSFLNKIPQQWMGYNTATDPSTFIINILSLGFYQFIFFWALLTLLFALAESLTRRAFTDQLQLLSLWRTHTASSKTVIGSTLTAYLLVSIIIALQAAFYIFTARYFGWWMPSEHLLDPNILSTYAPFLEPLSKSLTAGFLEECLFRAIPLASAAFLGKKYHHRGLFLVIAFIVQALIFGAAHANYPMQPAYARIIELFVPSLIFGGLYLAFGLLPAIINHFVFDLVLMSIPIFMTSGDHNLINEVLIILLGLIPLLICLMAFIKKQGFSTPPIGAYNRDYSPPPLKSPITPPTLKIVPEQTYVFWLCLVLSLAGLSMWLIFAKHKADVPDFNLDKEEAISQAQIFLTEHDIPLDESWSFIAEAKSSSYPLAEEFILKKGGKELFEKLVGTYIDPPHWLVRIVKFGGAVEERAEEYVLLIDTNAYVYSFSHILPEEEARPSLSEDSARTIAEKALKMELGENASKLTEISAIQHKLPNRNDWVFVWQDTKRYPLKEGRAEVLVKVSGNEVSSWTRNIYVPEQWVRNKESKEQLTPLFTLLSLIPFVLILLIGAILGFLCIQKDHRAQKIALASFIFIAAILIVNTINLIPSFEASFNTTLSHEEQMMMVLATKALLNLLLSMSFALVLAYIMTSPSQLLAKKSLRNLLAALFFGLFFSGIEALVFYFIKGDKPVLPDLLALNSYIPMLESLVEMGVTYLSCTCFLLLLVKGINKGIKKSQRLFYIGLFLLFLSGIFLSFNFINITGFWVIAATRGAILIVGYLLLFRYQPSSIAIFFASYYAITAFNNGLINCYSHSIINGVIIGAAIIALGIFLYFRIDNQKPSNSYSMAD